MSKIRVHELSKELGIKSKDLIRILNEMGAGVKNHMSTIKEEYLIQVRRSFNTGAAPLKKAPPSTAKKPSVDPEKIESKPTSPSPAPKKASQVKKTASTETRGVATAGLGTSAKDAVQERKRQPEEKRSKGEPQVAKSAPRREVPSKSVTGSKRPTEIRPVEKAQVVKKEASDRLAAPSKAQPTGVKEEKPSPTSSPKKQPPATTKEAPTRPAPLKDRKAPTSATRPVATEGREKERQPVRATTGEKPRPTARTAKSGRAQETPNKPGAQQKTATPHQGARERFKKTGQARDTRNFRGARGGRRGREKTKPAQPLTNVKSVQAPQSLTVKEFAQAIEVAVGEVIKKLMSLGVMATINKEIDLDTAILVGEEFGVTVTGAPTEEEELKVEEIVDEPESLTTRWPVVTVMGHVDHGKTSLLDAIRETEVTASEAGGITQHIGAYQVESNSKKITFLDTPGHEAFTAMRARGAQATDIAVLVVAADDGVMPQTVEAINHAKAAKIPIIVAINKIDKPTANPDRVKQELTQYGLVMEEWGGETICVEVSALKKTGLDELLEMILLVAEMREFKANPNRAAKGIVIEAKLDRGRGPVATVLIQTGTLKIGDNVIAGKVSGRVRALVNDKGKMVPKAGPSEPVEIVGLDDVPEAGDTFYVTEEKIARELAERRQQFSKEQEFKKYQRVSLDDLFVRIKEGEMKDLNLIIKADVHGSVEAITQSLERLSSDEVRIRVIHGGVGAVNESDIMLASASEAIIIGFNVRPDPTAKRLAEREDVDIRFYRVIYNIIEDVQKAMEGMLSPEFKEVVLGRAEVRAVFKVPKAGSVAGSFVLEGKITRNAEARVIRDNVVIYDGKIESLKRFKDDVKEVSAGFECGIGLERFNDIKVGDVIEIFVNQEIKKTGTTDSGG